MEQQIQKILAENDRRVAENNRTFNPITGEGSILEREKTVINDFPIRVQYLPVAMLKVPLVKQLVQAGSIRKYQKLIYEEQQKEEGISFDSHTEEEWESDRQKIIEQFTRIRNRFDFAFWAAVNAYIKRKGGGEDILFRLNRPQRKLIERFEKRRMAGKPIRLVLLKARQWGGSTATQIYMAWLQLVHKTGLNSLIVGHVKDASTEVKDMFDKLIAAYPVELLHEMGEAYNENEARMVGVGKTGNIQRIVRRNCKIKIGTAEKPDSARGGDYNLIHCTEVGLWKVTDGKTPEDIVRSATSGVLYRPYTMIVYESTANGTGNFFQREYDAAKKGKSQFESLFIAWWEIEQYEIPFSSLAEKAGFAKQLYENRLNRNKPSDREESGKYLWWLWQLGATLEAINWYVIERAKYGGHGLMAAEYPSDDVEAFVHSGERVFDKYKVELLRSACRTPRYVGDIYADGDSGEEALEGIRFSEDKQGLLWIWEMPEPDTEEEEITDRYLTVVDIGGRGQKADFSVITVFDRIWQMEGGKPIVVAQWYGHIDMDVLAWKAAQIAAFYKESLLVIESNTLETKDKEREVDGDQSHFILNQIKDVYPNLYARKQSEDDIAAGIPRKYGFHTNVATKPMIISTLVKVIRESLYTERDERCLDEYLTYERKQNGAYGAIAGKHDDLLMTRAIGLHICFKEMELPRLVKRSRKRCRKKKAVGAASL